MMMFSACLQCAARVECAGAGVFLYSAFLVMTSSDGTGNYFYKPGILESSWFASGFPLYSLPSLTIIGPGGVPER